MMSTYAKKMQENKSQVESKEISQKQHSGASHFQLEDNRSGAITQRKMQDTANHSQRSKPSFHLQDMVDSHTQRQQPLIQKKSNHTGLPDHLKAGIENLSGYSMEDVKVHYNSAKPAQLQAHAYAQGNSIYLQAGQEKHLPHEAWHVVQQKQGRVVPTHHMNGNMKVNNEARLEKEADIMGSKALAMSPASDQAQALGKPAFVSGNGSSSVKQLKESTTLVAGGLNMIGESHSDYAGEVERGIEANKIKSVLGKDNRYRTEGLLKTQAQELDYSDPVYLRLEQVFGFIIEEGGNLLQQLKQINMSSLEKKTKEQKGANNQIELIVKELVPFIASDEYKLEDIMNKITSKKLTKTQLEQLGSGEAWDVLTLDPDGKYWDNFYKVQDTIQEIVEKMDDTPSSAYEEVDDSFIKARSLIYLDFYKFYDTYKGRLPLTLKLYYNLNKKEHVTTKLSRFNFNIDFIKSLLSEWESIEKLREIVTEVMTSQKIELVPKLVEVTIEKIEKLIRLIREGQLGSGLERPTNEIRIHRSIDMDKAAQKLKGENIAWKVGNLHVEDIKFMESLGITNTEYTYITKENFKTQIAGLPEIDADAEHSKKIGADYLEAKKEVKEITNDVDKSL